MLFGIGLFIGLASLVGVLVVLSSLLQTAVRLSYRMIGDTTSEAVIGWDWDSDEKDEPGWPQNTGAIPELSMLRGIGFVLIAGVANLIVSAIVRLVLTFNVGRDSSELWPAVIAAHLIGLGAGFAALLGLLTSYLPTTSGRAALAAFLFHLLLVVLVGVITLVVNLVFD